MSNQLRAVLGTMTIGGQVAENKDVLKILQVFSQSKAALSVPEIDTARMYQGGKTEVVIGQILEEESELKKKIAIATKVNPFQGERLNRERLTQQAEACFSSLRTEKVDLFYLHGPDATTSIDETLETVQKLYEQGKFSRFGISNFTSWETVYIHSYMKERNWIVPSVYQGMYNGITRKVEEEIFPALRRLGMSFYGYNPLAGGMLTGKYKSIADAQNEGGRFKGDSHWANIYRNRFMQEQQFEALEIIQKACDSENITMASSALRWVHHHSALSASRGDAVIIGGSKLEHLNANLEDLTKGPLPESVLEAWTKAWNICQPICPSYSRGYSGSDLEK